VLNAGYRSIIKRFAQSILPALVAVATVHCGGGNGASSDHAAGGSGPSTGGNGGGGVSTGGNGGGGVSTGGTGGSGIGGGGGGRPNADSGTSPPTCAVDAGVAMPTGTPPSLQAGQWVDISPPGLNRPRASAPPFGCMDIHVSPCNPYVLYLTTDSEGMWRSSDGGANWVELGGVVGSNGNSPGDMEINPANPLEMYAVGGVRGASLGFWTSNDGGNTWSQPAGFSANANNSVGGWSNDLYDVHADPVDFKHVLVTFHSGWEGTGNAGVLESKDGGNTWIRHLPQNGWGAGHSIWFLGDSKIWLLGTQGDGYWRTTDAGTTWKQITTTNMQHGGVSAYYSTTGILYVGALSQILRSADNGLTFTLVGPHTQDGYYAIIGDGNNLYTQLGNTGGNTVGDQPYLTSPESDGVTWSDFSSQKFSDGPYRMAFDAKNRIVYSANWNAGVWALKVE
jgi:photosystem II stability/assembly factor-like uncharacterized protein